MNYPLEMYPNVLFIYNFTAAVKSSGIELHTIILQGEHIQHIEWNPVRNGSLALCCSNSGLYIWMNERETDVQADRYVGVAECIGVPIGS